MDRLATTYAPSGAQDGPAEARPGHRRALAVGVLGAVGASLCPYNVRTALRRVSGVIDASADLATHSARVTYQSEQTDVGALIAATTAAGYPSTLREPGGSGPAADKPGPAGRPGALGAVGGWLRSLAGGQ